ncbi:tryptophan-rich sensory protein [Neiella sp. HB171785]|uniref:Tryptophan-rich sensory protein n=1 Tax=Neiella litorisoli TaxID=2771431 RepID=A0A8J6UPI3_9GAMM|nr:TspO/MBR family protein [Neiella litorisoli]MBD1388487.1 tryptophan-rich sensory protein [Neiella litorisoli]
MAITAQHLNHQQRPSGKQQALVLLAFVGLCHLVSFIGAIASINSREFYAMLTQPWWSPPGWVFGPVWLTLYTMMAISAWLIWRQHAQPMRQSALTLFLVHLLPNALWSWLFFAWQLGAASLVNIIILWLLIVAVLRRFAAINKVAALLLVPYLAWVSFAAVLNFWLWQHNPALL